jgi:2-oxoglutarate dehydrogenase E2 component (dihydrolipoamide succinyltransferase)
MATDVIVPALGESITEASVGQWLKQPGEAVVADEAIVALETDKVAVEVPSPVAGVMGEQMFKPGDTVTVGALIARIVEGGVPAAAVPVPVAAAPAAAAAAPVPAAESPAYDAISPAVRGLLDTYNLDPASIGGTGKDGRLTKGDVLAAIEAGTARLKSSATPAPAAVAAVAAAPAERREERVKMTRLRQTIARRLKEAQNSAAMLTTFNDVDMAAVIEARAKYKDMFEKKHGIRLGFMSFFAKAVVLALKDVPSVGAAIEGDEIIYKDYADLGVAVSSPGGLVVPILRKHCSECHTGDKKKGGLSMNTRASLLEGGENGAVVTAGQAQKSKLLEAIVSADPDLRMPPKGDRLSPTEVATLRAWVEQGAVWTDGFAFKQPAYEPPSLRPRRSR